MPTPIQAKAIPHAMAELSRDYLAKPIRVDDLPNMPAQYVHRIGRTACAGQTSRAIAFCAANEVAELKTIEKVLCTSIEITSGHPWEAMTGASKLQMKRRAGGRSERMTA